MYWMLKLFGHLTLKNHHSYKSNENIADIFQQMFYDSVIASKFSCGEKKTAYYSVFGIAPYLTNLLQDSLLQRESYVLLFDESLNDMRQKQQMDICARFWSNNEVKTMFLTSVFLVHGTAEDLFDAFIEAISLLKLSKVRIINYIIIIINYIIIIINYIIIIIINYIIL